MPELFGVPLPALFAQLTLGLINGAFYAMLSLGLAVIFGMLNVVNFAHGALYMTGAFVTWLLLDALGIGYWWALLLSPLAVGVLGVLIERSMLQWLYRLDHLYGLLLTFGIALAVQGLFTNQYGSSGQPYQIPESLAQAFDLGFMRLPFNRAWVVLASLVICFGTWFVIERTKLGSLLRAATENASLVQSFGINVPRMITLTYAAGVGLAALAGVLATTTRNVSPQMGADLIIIVFAVVVIGGMGSIMGAILTGFALGVIEGFTKVFLPEASNTVIFIVMALVLLVKPAGLFGKAESGGGSHAQGAKPDPASAFVASGFLLLGAAVVWGLVLYGKDPGINEAWTCLVWPECTIPASGAVAAAKPGFEIYGLPGLFWFSLATMAFGIFVGHRERLIQFFAGSGAPQAVSGDGLVSHAFAFVIMTALFVAAPLLGLYPVSLAKVLCFALFACAFNLLIGFGGLLSFGHAAFWGSAAYASAHAAARWGFSPEAAIVFATAVAGVLGAVIGGFAIRRQGIYFAMITLAFAQMIFFLALQVPFTGGEDGLQLGNASRAVFAWIPLNWIARQFGEAQPLWSGINLRDNMTLYWFVLGVFLVGFLFIYRVIHSPFGQVLKAIRENEPRAVSLGYYVDRYKLIAFVLSAMLAGLAGGTKVFVTGSAATGDVNWPMSGEVVLMALLGGLGTIFGPVMGAAVLIMIEEFLAERAGAWVSVIQGGIFVLCVLAFRRGIVGEIARVIKKPL